MPADVSRKRVKKTEHHVTRQDVIWNMAGSTASAIASAIMVLGVTRIAGAENGGVFSIAFSTAQMLMMLGNYGIRTYQVSDAQQRFSFGEYFWNRVLTCILMMVSGILWCSLFQYDLEKSLIVLLVCACRMVEAFADVLEGRMHQQYHLAIAGKSLALRTACYSGTFFLTLIVTGSLFSACCVMLGTTVFCVLAYTVSHQRRTCPGQGEVRVRNVLLLLQTCFPLFLSMFLLMYIVNSPKYAIDALGTEQEQACYAILYLPAQVIALFSTYIFKPMINGLTENWQWKRFQRFFDAIVRVSIGLLAITLLGMLGAYLLGIPILSLLSALELSSYKGALVLIMLGGGFSALASMLTQVLTIMRRQNAIMIGYVVTAGAALVVPYMLVRQNGVLYASASYVILMLLLSMTQLIPIAIAARAFYSAEK